MSGPAGPVVIAVDAGTGSVRALAFGVDGTLVARAGREWTHHPIAGHPGGTDFDTTAGWRLTGECLREVVQTVEGCEILAVAASSMREGFVLYEAGGVELFACPNTDGRARGQADELVESGLADAVYARGGDWVSITAPARLLWLEQNAPGLLDRAAHLGMISDWITYRLTGEFTTDPTCGSSTALFDLATRDWARDLVEACHLDPAVLPPVLEPGTIAGRVTEAASATTGLRVGTPVVVGGADTQLALHGVGATSEAATVIAGTFWQTTMIVDTPLIDPRRRLRTLCHVADEQWMIEGIGFLSGLALRWFRDGFCQDALGIEEATGRTAFAVMEEWAAAVPPGSNGVKALLSNVMQADAWHHATPSFVGFDFAPETSNRASFIRAIEESAAYVTKAHLDILDELLDGRVKAAGEFTFTGGSSAGSLWPSIVASVVGLPARLSQVAEATSFGAARLAASGVGVDLRPAVASSRRVEPDEQGAYRGLYTDWRRAYAAQRVATVVSGLNPLFTPPGALPASGASTAKEGASHG